MKPDFIACATILLATSVLSASSSFDDFRMPATGTDLPEFVSMSSKRLIPGNGGLAMEIPEPFKIQPYLSVSHRQQASKLDYQVYEYNGVRIGVGTAVYKNNMEANERVQQLLSGQFPLINSVNGHIVGPVTLDLHGIEGTHYEYRYTMMPMAKSMVYRTLGLVDKSKVWIITAGYKQCDNRGRSVTDSVFASISRVSKDD